MLTSMKPVVSPKSKEPTPTSLCNETLPPMARISEGPGVTPSTPFWSMSSPTAVIVTWAPLAVTISVPTSSTEPSPEPNPILPWETIVTSPPASTAATPGVSNVPRPPGLVRSIPSAFEAAMSVIETVPAARAVSRVGTEV